MTTMPTIELVMAEFGAERLSAGDAILPAKDRLNPTLDSFRKHFPEAKVSLYTDCPAAFAGVENSGVIVRHIQNPKFNAKHSRYGWRCNDYYSVMGLVESEADISIAMDADMMIVSDDVRAIIPLTSRFGMCIPANGRFIVRSDANAVDGSDRDDESLLTGHAYAMSPISVQQHCKRSRHLLTVYLDEMRRNPVRGPLAMWRAVWASFIHPYLLPPQWCVCSEQCGIGQEIILHVGHKRVADWYVERIRASR